MKKRTRLLYGLLLLCAPLAGCLKEDDGSQFYSDVYWFPLAKQTFSVDTREPEPVDTVVLVFRARNFVYDSDTVNFAVMPDSTTAVAGTDYEITTPVVRFGKDDYYDNLLRGEIGLRIYPTLSDTLTLALKLIYTHPANEERFRLHDRTVLTLRPIFPSESTGTTDRPKTDATEKILMRSEESSHRPASPAPIVEECPWSDGEAPSHRQTLGLSCRTTLFQSAGPFGKSRQTKRQSRPTNRETNRPRKFQTVTVHRMVAARIKRIVIRAIRRPASGKCRG